MDWKMKTVSLTHPIENGEGTVREITLREPDVDALEQIEDLKLEEGKRPTTRQLRGVIAALADVSNEVVGKVHRDDLGALGEAVVPLLADEETAAKA